MTADIHIARYWDRIQGSKFDVDALAQRLDRIFKERGMRRILDLGCGTGTLLLALARQGYECVGIDLDRCMLDEARRKARSERLTIDFRIADLRRLELTERFDAVLSFQVFSLLRDGSDICLALGGIGDVLSKGGMLAFDVLIRREEGDGMKKETGVCPLFIDAAMEAEDGDLVRINRMMEMDRALQWQAIYFFQERGTVKMGVRTIPLASYSEAEIIDMLRQWGFAVQDIQLSAAGGPRRLNAQILAVRDSDDGEETE